MWFTFSLKMLSWIIIYWSVRHRHAYPNVVWVLLYLFVLSHMDTVRLFGRPYFLRLFFFYLKSRIISIRHKHVLCDGDSSKKKEKGKNKKNKDNDDDNTRSYVSHTEHEIFTHYYIYAMLMLYCQKKLIW